MERLALEANQMQHPPSLSDSSSPTPMQQQLHNESDAKLKVERPRPKKSTKSANTSLNSSAERDDKKFNKKKGQKLYCVCQTPYDKSK